MIFVDSILGHFGTSSAAQNFFSVRFPRDQRLDRRRLLLAHDDGARGGSGVLLGRSRLPAARLLNQRRLRPHDSADASHGHAARDPAQPAEYVLLSAPRAHVVRQPSARLGRRRRTLRGTALKRRSPGRVNATSVK